MPQGIELVDRSEGARCEVGVASGATACSPRFANPAERHRARFISLLVVATLAVALPACFLHGANEATAANSIRTALFCLIVAALLLVLALVGAGVHVGRARAFTDVHAAVAAAVHDESTDVLVLEVTEARSHRFAEAEFARRGPEQWDDCPFTELVILGPGLGCLYAAFFVTEPREVIAARFAAAYALGAAAGVFLRSLYRHADSQRRSRQLGTKGPSHLVLFQRSGEPAAAFYGSEAVLVEAGAGSMSLLRDVTERDSWMLSRVGRLCGLAVVERFPLEPGQEDMAAAWLIPRADAFAFEPDAEPDLPGRYRVLETTHVTEHSDVESDNVAQVNEGTVVEVLDIVVCPTDQRVRGRIEQPSGWISLLDTANGHRWAEQEADFTDANA